MSEDDLNINLVPAPVVEAAPIGATLASKLAAAQLRRKPPVTVALEADDTVAVRYRSVIPLVLRDRFTKLFRQEKDLDAHIGLLLANCEAILVNGAEVMNDEGKRVTFNDSSFISQLGASGPQEALARFYGGADGLDSAAVEIFAVANTIYRAGAVSPSKDEKGNPLD